MKNLNTLIKSIEDQPVREIKNTNYFINSQGDVYNATTLQKLTPQIMFTSGYLYVPLKIDGKQVNKYIHRLVAEAFIEKPYQSIKLVVDHIDNNRFNNTPTNLRWTTRRRNAKRLRNKYKSYTIIDPITLEKAFKYGLSTSKICDLFNISPTTVYRHKRAFKANQKKVIVNPPIPYIC